MSNFDFEKEYYLTTYNEINEYINSILNDDENKQIKYIFTNGSLGWRKLNNSKKYSLDSEIYIVFDNDSILRVDYKFYGLLYARHMWIQNLNKQEKEFNNDNYKLELDIANSRIDGYEIERFSEEYEINPSTGTSRPHGGDYFKKITLNLSNNKKLCICAEDAEVDGYCEIWVE